MTTAATSTAASEAPSMSDLGWGLGIASLSFGRIGPRQRRHIRQAGMRAAEVGRGRVLTDRDDALADRSGAGEVVEQRVAVTAADGARQCGDVLVEAAEHLQHRILV